MKPIYTVTLLAVLLASLSALQAAESPAPLANPERMPVFSWDHVPLYVHIRKDTAFTDEEIKYLATFSLVTFEKATGHTDSGSVEVGTLKAARVVKAINPDTKILYYCNVIIHYGGYAANASIENIPGAFLVGRDGNDKLIRNKIQAYDLTNPAVRNWWIAAVKDVCSDPVIDGVFLDGVVKVLEPVFLKGVITPEKKAARQGFIVAYTCGLGRNRQDADETQRSAASNNNRVRRGKDAQGRFDYQLAIFLICAEKYSYFDLKDGYDAKLSKTWLTRRADYDSPLGPPKGPAVRDGYTYTREFNHVSIQLDIENETASIVWK